MTAICHRPKAVYALVLVLFLDGLGQGLFFPILAGMLLHPHANYLLTDASMDARNFWYGAILGCFALFWFIGGPILSDFSDSKGRKFSLLICLAGSAFGYLLSAFSILLHSMTIMLLGRAIDGFTAGAQSIAQAAVIDVSSEKEKAQNIAFVLMALTIGLIAGPLVGGVFSDHRLVSWFSFTTPMYFALMLAIINFILLLRYYPSMPPSRPGQSLSVMRALRVFVPVWQYLNLRKILVGFFFIQLGWAITYIYITEYVTVKYKFSIVQSALVFAAIGLGLTIGFRFVVKKLEGRFTSRQIVIFSYLVYLVFLTGLFFKDEIFIWMTSLGISIAFACGYTFLIEIFSRQVDAEHQGWVMGVTGSIIPLCAIIASALISWLPIYGVGVPNLLSFILVTIGWLSFCLLKFR